MALLLSPTSQHVERMGMDVVVARLVSRNVVLLIVRCAL